MIRNVRMNNMIIRILVCTSILLLSGCGKSDSQKEEAPVLSLKTIDDYLSRIEVSILDLDIEDRSKSSADGPLWDYFANKPYESQFSTMSTKNWEKDWIKFRDKILQKARSQNHETDTLKSILEKSHADTKARSAKREIIEAKIPVGAFLANQGKEKVWIVVFKWEYVNYDKEKDEYEDMSFGHIEVLAFRITDGECVDGTRCD